jgi:hypothetical protein
MLRFHPLDRDTRVAWGLFVGLGANLLYSGLLGAGAQVGAEIGYRWVRVSLALQGNFWPSGVTRLEVGVLPALTFALPF